MEKILVTTDQSANSKSAIRFAIKLAKQRGAELIFLHVYHLLKPFKWKAATFAQYTTQFQKNLAEELSSFMNEIFKSVGETEINYQLALISNTDVVDGIRDYADKHNCSYICISTRGAGTLSKIFGTHTAKLISSSTVPVLCIPSAYRLKDLKHILYASDMTDYENELKMVVDFARPLQAGVDMIHISYPYELIWDREMAEEILQKKTAYPVHLLTHKRNMSQALLKDLEHAVKVSKPTILVLFTHQSKSLFERLFFSSNAEEYSFFGKIPLLTFPKSKNQKKQR